MWAEYKLRSVSIFGYNHPFLHLYTDNSNITFTNAHFKDALFQLCAHRFPYV